MEKNVQRIIGIVRSKK